MSELLAGLFGIAILIVAWIAIRIGEKVTSLERRLRRFELMHSDNHGRVIGSQSQALERNETETRNLAESQAGTPPQ